MTTPETMATAGGADGGGVAADADAATVAVATRVATGADAPGRTAPTIETRRHREHPTRTI